MGRHLGIVGRVGLVAVAVGWGTVAGARGADDQPGRAHGPIDPPTVREPVHLPVPIHQQRAPQDPAHAGYVNTAPGNEGWIPPASEPGVWDETSWISWWETNRDAVLKVVLKRRPAPGPGPVAAEGPAGKLPPERQRAAAALVKATGSEQPAVRAAAAVSLGQMRQADALPRLVELAKGDPEWYVRGMAWAGVGLAGGERAEAALVSAAPRTEFEQLGVIAGIGLLDQPTERAFGVLRKLVTAPLSSPEVVRMTTWALRVYHRPQDHDLVAQTLKGSGARLPVMSECLLALGAMGEAADLVPLADVACGGHVADIANVRNVVAGGGVRQTGVRGTYAYPFPSNGGGGQQQQQQQLPSRRGVPARQPSVSLDYGQQGSSGLSAGARTYYPRVSAALALGLTGGGAPMAAGSPVAMNALIQNFAPYLDQGGPVFAGASVMSFAAAAGPQDVYLLRDVLEMSPDPALGTLVSPKSPLRGYAALGIGLYLARGGPASISTRPPGVVVTDTDSTLPEMVDLNELLALRYTNRQESSELRAACALALGLSGDPANVRRLLQGAGKIDRRDELLLGYTTLALGMLGERAALNAAGPLLAGGATRLDADAVAARGVAQPGVRLSLRAGAVGANGANAAALTEAPAVPQGGVAASAVLGRRAALLGVALLGDARAEPILAGAWARDRATVQDVGRAMGWCRAYGAADALSDVVAREKKGAVEAAVTLGWVFDPDRPSRLSRLVVGNNYHEPQGDYVEANGGGSVMVLRNYPRLGDSYLYSSPVGGQPVGPGRAAQRGPATRPAAP